MAGGHGVPLRGALEVWGSSCLGCLPSGRTVGVRHCLIGVHALRRAACRGVGGSRLSRGVAFQRCGGHLASGAVPLLASRPWGRVVWAWGTQYWPHSVVCSREPGLRAVGVAGGLTREGTLRCCGGRLRSGAYPPPAARHLGGLLGPAARVLWARVCGSSTVPLACMPCGGLCATGVVERHPGDGWPSAVVEGFWCQALSLSRPPVPGGGRPGPAARVSRARVVWAWGAQHWPHSVRSCEPALPAVGVAGGLRLRGCLVPWRPAAPPRGGLSGPAAHVLWARVCRRGGPGLCLWLACPAGGCVTPG